jgi:lysozyme family protein
MANFDIFFPKILSSEGTKYENDPTDLGGCTHFGIILETLIEFHLDKNHDGKYTCDDVLALTLEDAKMVYKKLYWDFFKADNIKNQSLAEYIVDGAINQGKYLIAKYVQSILKVTPDAIIGSKTLQAINSCDSKMLFNTLKQMRTDRYNRIVAANPSQKKFIKGWMNRVKCIEYNA